MKHKLILSLAAALALSLGIGAILLPEARGLAATGENQKLDLTSTNSFAKTTASDANRSVVKTPLKNDVPFFSGGLVQGSGVFGLLYGKGYLYNQWALNGIQSLTINFSGTGTLRLAYGFAVQNYLYATTNITSGTPITMSIHPNFFYLENISGTGSYCSSQFTSTSHEGSTTSYSSYGYAASFDDSVAVSIASIEVTYSCVNEATETQKLHRYINVTGTSATGSALNIRNAPGTSGTTVLYTLNHATYTERLAYRETVLDSDGDPWYRTYWMNQDAYISGSTSYTTLCTSPNYGNQNVESLIAEAEKRMGDRYYLGATRYITTTGTKISSFNEMYYDCSSYVMRAVYDGTGMVIGNYTGSQITYGTKVSFTAGSGDYSNLKRGDLLFFTSGTTPVTEANVGHVGIYAEEGLVLNDAGGDYTGTVRCYPNLPNYWQNYLIEGRRLFA
jgi:cell wall-associated NlpC family hydrolase